MRPGEFFLERLGRIAGQCLCALAAAAFLLATGTQTGVVELLVIAWLLIFLAAQACDFWRAKTRLDELEAVMEGLDRRYLFVECAPKPQGLYERKMFDLLRLSGKSMIEEVSGAQAAGRAYQEYVEQWVHEIKTPITAARLISQSAGPDTRRKLTHELAQIDAHVERALFYARAESPEKDFIIRKTALAEICGTALQAHQSLLIHKDIRVETEGLDETVYTDGKWASFMVGQLLQNAARYCGEAPVITLATQRLGQQVQLIVRDNGMGIPAHELPRVFDRGFTGSNGRRRGGSTGMGLYLCRRLAEALEIHMQISAAEGEGTSVTMTFPAGEKLSKP